MFEPAREQVTEVQATVQGSLPAWLEGSHLVNGGGEWTGAVDSLMFWISSWIRNCYVYTMVSTKCIKHAHKKHRHKSVPLARAPADRQPEQLCKQPHPC